MDYLRNVLPALVTWLVTLLKVAAVQRAVLVATPALVTPFLLTPTSAEASSSQFYAGYCTRYAAQKFDETAPAPQCNWNGNAYQWMANASAKAWNTSTNSRSAVRGAVVVWRGGGYGHVAYVENVTAQGINISEMNWGPLSPVGNTNGTTTNFNRVTTAFLPYDRLNRGSYTFSGYVLPTLKGSVAPSPSPAPLSNGLYRASDEGTVYFVSGGVRRAIPSAECFDDWGFRWDNIRVVSRADIERCAWGVPLQHLVTIAGNGTVWWIQDGFKRPIASASIFESMGFSWNDVRTLDAGRVNRFPTGPLLDRIEPNLVVVDGTYISPWVAARGQGIAAGLRVRNIAKAGVSTQIAVSYWAPNGAAGNFTISPTFYLNPGAEYVWWSPTTSFWTAGRYGIKPAFIVNGRWHQIPHSGITRPTQGFFDIS